MMYSMRKLFSQFLCLFGIHPTASISREGPLYINMHGPFVLGVCRQCRTVAYVEDVMTTARYSSYMQWRSEMRGYA